MRITIVLMLALVLLLFVASALVYARLPPMVASHWDAAGRVNGYLPRFVGVFLFPLLTVVVLGILLLIPVIDPLKANIRKFLPAYDAFVIVFLAFMLYLHLLILSWNLGIGFNLLRWLIPAFAILFFAVGALCERTKRNWTIGIRTPWTISDDKVWARTHMLGGKLFKVAAVLVLLGMFFPAYAILFLLIPLILAGMVSVVYSYVIFQEH